MGGGEGGKGRQLWDCVNSFWYEAKRKYNNEEKSKKKRKKKEEAKEKSKIRRRRNRKREKGRKGAPLLRLQESR